MSDQSYRGGTSEQAIISPYLLRPIRTREQALADIRNSRRPSNVHSFFPAISSRNVVLTERSSAA